MRRTVAAALWVVASTAGQAGALAATGVIYAGSGGTGSAQFSLNSTATCRYTATMKITKMWVDLSGKKVLKAYLATTMTETNQACPQAALGAKKEYYRLRTGDFDGKTLKLNFASAEGNASKHDAIYEGTLSGNKISGEMTFARWDCAANCNWTIKVPQALARQQVAAYTSIRSGRGVVSDVRT
jgi:hypothetical protein